MKRVLLALALVFGAQSIADAGVFFWRSSTRHSVIHRELGVGKRVLRIRQCGPFGCRMVTVQR